MFSMATVIVKPSYNLYVNPVMLRSVYCACSQRSQGKLQSMLKQLCTRASIFTCTCTVLASVDRIVSSEELHSSYLLLESELSL